MGEVAVERGRLATLTSLSFDRAFRFLIEGRGTYQTGDVRVSSAASRDFTAYITHLCACVRVCVLGETHRWNGLSLALAGCSFLGSWYLALAGILCRSTRRF